MVISRKIFGQLAEIILEGGAKQATKFLSPKEVIKATLQGNPDKRNRSNTILFTLGAPNYLERKFIKLAQKSGEPFPIKKVQIRQVSAV